MMIVMPSSWLRRLTISLNSWIPTGSKPLMISQNEQVRTPQNGNGNAQPLSSPERNWNFSFIGQADILKVSLMTLSAFKNTQSVVVAQIFIGHDMWAWARDPRWQISMAEGFWPFFVDSEEPRQIGSSARIDDLVIILISAVLTSTAFTNKRP